MLYFGVNVNLPPVGGVGVKTAYVSPQERNAEQAQSVMAEAADATRDTLADRGTPRSALQDLLDQPSFTSFDAGELRDNASS